MDSLKPTPKRSTLGRFHPERPMEGPWISRAAVGGLLVSMVMEGLFVSLIPAIVVGGLAIFLAWKGRITRGRVLAWIMLYASVLWMFVLLTAQFLGREVIGSG